MAEIPTERRQYAAVILRKRFGRAATWNKLSAESKVWEICSAHIYNVMMIRGCQTMNFLSLSLLDFCNLIDFLSEIFKFL